VSRSGNTQHEAVPLFGVEPLKGFVEKVDGVRLLLGHNNWPALAEESNRGERNILPGPIKARAADPKIHPHGLCRVEGLKRRPSPIWEEGR
jgi:hypothetical protein